RPSASVIAPASEGSDSGSPIETTSTTPVADQAKTAPESTSVEPASQGANLWSLDPPRRSNREHGTTVVVANTQVPDTQPAAQNTQPEARSSVALESPAQNSETIALWANTNLPAAISWAASLPESSTKNVVLTTLGYEAARHEPVAAIELARSLPANHDRDALLDHAINQSAVTDPASAQAW